MLKNTQLWAYIVHPRQKTPHPITPQCLNPIPEMSQDTSEILIDTSWDYEVRSWENTVQALAKQCQAEAKLCQAETVYV